MVKIFSRDKFNQLPDAVIFDLDNTLYPYDTAHTMAINTVKEKALKTFSVESKLFDEAFLEAKKQVKKRLFDTASSHNRLLYFQKMLEIMGLGSQILTALDFEQSYWRTFLNHAGLFENVENLFDDFRLLEIPIAIATDLTTQIQFRKIIHFGLDRYVDFVVTSEEVGHDKPHNSLFVLALEKLRPKGNLVWMIGDDAEKDIQGGRSINAVTLQKLHKSVSPGNGDFIPDASFHEYHELRSLLVKIRTH